MKKILITSTCALLAVGLIFTSCKQEKKDSSVSSEAPKQLVLRYAENQSRDYPTTQAAYKFAELVEQKTKGRIHIDIYYGAQLGNEKTVIEYIQLGTIDFTRVSLSPLSEFDKSLNILQLPYLYKDSKQMWRVLESDIGEKFLKGVERAGIIGLSWFDSGVRNFYNGKRPITKFDDLKGLKIGVQESRLMMEMVRNLNANPVPMAFDEVYTGLRSGIIDGAENSWPAYDTASHYEIAKYCVIDEHARVPEMQMISKITWNKLSPEDQKIIKECALESAKFERTLWTEKENAAKAKIQKTGTVITELAPGEREKFKEAMSPLYAEFGAGYEDVIESIQRK